MTLVLIVDDNERNRRLAGDLLRHGGLETLESATGSEALTLAADRSPHVILMDLQLPDMHGAEAAGRLRGDPRTAHIPIVAVTALPLDGDEDWLEAAGFAGWISKPIDVDRFVDEVKGWSAPSR